MDKIHQSMSFATLLKLQVTHGTPYGWKICLTVDTYSGQNDTFKQGEKMVLLIQGVPWENETHLLQGAQGWKDVVPEENNGTPTT